jgi:NTP pyrophosphatase (non-canonical NTP hydrolase)
MSAVIPGSTVATRSALEMFGDYLQCQMAIEEMAELTVAIKHHERGRVGIEAIQEELADVCIVLAQLVDVYGRDAIVQIAEQKQARLMQKVLEEEKLMREYSD